MADGRKASKAVVSMNPGATEGRELCHDEDGCWGVAAAAGREQELAPVDTASAVGATFGVGESASSATGAAINTGCWYWYCAW